MLTDWLIYLDYLEENNCNTSFLRLITPITFGIIECPSYNYNVVYSDGYGDGYNYGNTLGNGCGWGYGNNNGNGYGNGDDNSISNKNTFLYSYNDEH